MIRENALAELLDDLVTMVELREIHEPDAPDWTVEARIRRLERELALAYRAEYPPRAPADDPAAPRLAGVA
jgi:hypothetical protein